LLLSYRILSIPYHLYFSGVVTPPATLDFPGGRVLAEQKPVDAIPNILNRELGINKSDISHLAPLNQTGWAINSSFSNQKLYGFVAEINPEIIFQPRRSSSTIAILNDL
jgi:hypothetical protein